MALWLAFSILMAIILAYHKRIAEPITMGDLNPLEVAFANSLLRLGWSVALSIVIFLCVTGHGGNVNDHIPLRCNVPTYSLDLSIFIKRFYLYYTVFLFFIN